MKSPFQASISSGEEMFSVLFERARDNEPATYGQLRNLKYRMTCHMHGITTPCIQPIMWRC